jgi:hypothetical protein
MSPRDPAQLAATVMVAEIGENEIRLTFEISPADFATYGGLVPEAARAQLPAGTLVAGKLDPPSIRVNRETALSLTFNSADLREKTRRDELTGAILPPSPDGEKSLHVTWSASLPSKPEIIEFIPPAVAGGKGRIGMQVRHLGLAVNDFSWWKTPATFLLDWADPWYSKAGQPGMQRAFHEPLELFAVAEENEARLEIAARPADWLEMNASGDARISPAEQAAVLDQMRGRFLETLRLSADGKSLSLRPVSLRFLTRDLTGARPIAAEESIPVAAALVGAIFSCPLERAPRSLQLESGTLPPRLQRVPVTLRHSEGVSTGFIAPAQLSYEWKAAAPPTAAEPPLPGGKLDAWRLSVPWAWLGLLPGLVLCVALRKRAWPSRLAPIVLLPLLVGISTGWASWSHAFPKPEKSAVPLADDSADIIVLHVMNHCLQAFNEHDTALRQDRLAHAALPAAAAELEKHLLADFTADSLFGTPNQFRRLRWENRTYPANPRPGHISFQSDLHLLIGNAHWGHAHNRPVRFKAQLEISPTLDGWRLSQVKLVRQP